MHRAIFICNVMFIEPGAGMRYQHYKGGIYEFLYEATLESDLMPMVVYRAANGSVWIRPRDVFHEMIEVDGKRVPRFAVMTDVG